VLVAFIGGLAVLGSPGPSGGNICSAFASWICCLLASWMANMSSATTDGAVFHGAADGVLTSDELEAIARGASTWGAGLRAAAASPPSSPGSFAAWLPS
jgi:hypothetical protein